MLQHFRAKKHNINKIMRYRHLESAGIVSIIKRSARNINQINAAALLD
jgi:hypothetical protein